MLQYPYRSLIVALINPFKGTLFSLLRPLYTRTESPSNLPGNSGLPEASWLDLTLMAPEWYPFALFSLGSPS